MAKLIIDQFWYSNNIEFDQMTWIIRDNYKLLMMPAEYARLVNDLGIP